MGKEQSVLRKKDRRLWREVGGSEKGDSNATRWKETFVVEPVNSWKRGRRKVNRVGAR